MRWWMRIGVLVAALAAASAASADTIDVNGVMRSYIAQLPPARPAPLVVVLHGKTQRGADMITRTAWPLIAKRDGFAVVYPDGLNNAWADARPEERRAGRGPPEGTDDVAFIAKLVEKLVADGTTDAKRVYVTGISNGGAMTMTLVCARADLFAAGATVIMNLTDESAAACHPSRPLPMLMMNGTVDPLIPYEGGRGSSYFAADGFWSTTKTLAFCASTMADIACPACFPTRISRNSPPACSGPRTAISTVPIRSGPSLAGFLKRTHASARAHACPATHACLGWQNARRWARQGRHLKEIPMSIQRFETGPRMSQVVVHGNTVYLAGVVANNAAGESVTKQTQDILATIDGHLAKAGTDKSKLLSATIYITDMKTFQEMNAVWDGWVSAGNTPARATVEAKLAAPQYTVEIMVTAAK